LYDLKSDFDIGKPGTVCQNKKAGIYSFGIGRQFYDKVYLPYKKSN
jgi:hypothetical protein